MGGLLAYKHSIYIPEPSLSSRKEHQKQEKRQLRLERFNEVHKLYKEGLSKSQIAKQVKMSRGTVIKYLESKALPEQQARASKLGKLKPFVKYLNERFIEGCHNINQLWRDIQVMGYEAKRPMAKRYVHYLKGLTEEQLQALASPKFYKPKAKALSYALLKSTDALTMDMQYMLKQLSLICNDFDEFRTRTVAFDSMIKQKKEALFLEWLEQATQSSISLLKNFANKLKKDQEAIHNAMKYPWSNGQLEGQVNRLKTIKRQMYGRANFDLLKARILYQGP